MRPFQLLIVLLLGLNGQLLAASPLSDGLSAYQAGNYSAAYDKLLPLAKQGEATAAYYVGMMYTDGQGVAQNSANGVRWLERAVELHHREAAIMLGKIYMSGLGVPLDHTKAMHFLDLAEKLRQPEDDEDCD